MSSGQGCLAVGLTSNNLSQIAVTLPIVPALVLKSGKSTTKLNGVGKVGETVREGGNLISRGFFRVTVSAINSGRF